MNLLPILGLIFVILFAGLIVFYMTFGKNRRARAFRDVPAFTRLRRAVGLAVEAGTRLQIGLGWGSPAGSEFAPGLAGLTVLDRVARAASVSDRPPLAVSGEGTTSILSQDTLHSAYRSMGVETRLEPQQGRLVGVSPFSYAAGVIPLIYDESVSTNVTIGHFTQEIALINDAADRKGSLSVAGTDSLPAQAVAYASSQEALIGEEVFAGGAYLGAGSAHEASLQVQDILRIVVIGLLIAGAIARLFGLDLLLANSIPGLMTP